MKARKAGASRARSGAALRLALQVGSLIVVLAAAAFLFGTLSGSPDRVSGGPSDTTAAAPVDQPPAAKPSAGGYRRVELGAIGFGQEADQVGLSVQKEARPRGPSSLAVGPDGRIYVGDDVNGRVQVYSSAGKHASTIKVDERIRDLAVSSLPDLFVLSGEGEVLAFDRTTGQSRGRWALEGKPAKSLGKLRLSADSLALESPQQVTYPIGAAGSTGVSVLPIAEQEAQAKKGGRSASKTFYSTTYREGGHVYRLDEKGNVVQDVSLGLPNVLSVVYLDEDRAGSVYVQVESLTEDEQVDVEVWQFDKKGVATAAVPVEPLTYAEMVRSVVVTESGEIYQAVPSKQGLSLVKWVRQ